MERLWQNDFGCSEINPAQSPGAMGNIMFDLFSLVEAACLPGDSLTICFAADGSFDPGAVGILAAPHTHQHMMVAKERASQLPAAGKPDWPRLVASPGGHFEVVFTSPVSLAAIGCVRVPKAEYDRLWDMAFASFARKLGDAERALVHDFVQMRKGVVDGRIRLEIIA